MSPQLKQRLSEQAVLNPRLSVLGFITEPTTLVARADRIIAMGGYNTVCEVLSFGKRALIVPRTKPRREQFIRAERLSKLGLIDMLEFDRLNPQALSEWMGRELPPLQVDGRINLNGLDRLPALAQEVLAAPRAMSPGA